MTRQLIEITFGNALAQATQLENCADDLIRLANEKIENVKTDVGMAWQGDSAQAYLGKMELTEANILATANKLNEAAATIRRIARIFRESELRAIEIAEQRMF